MEERKNMKLEEEMLYGYREYLRDEELYGITKSGWTNGATFSITPTFTIAVK